MAKKIQLHKQTLRVLSTEEMEAVAGGAYPATQVCLSVNCYTDDPAPEATNPATDTSLSANCISGEG